MLAEPPLPANEYCREWAQWLADNFRQKLNRDLITEQDPVLGLGFALYYAPFAVLAHNADPDPKFVYANRVAQELFALTWEEIIGMPSRLSAEAENRKARARMLAQAGKQGYIEHYSGIRIAKNGCRFRIEQAIIWNLQDASGADQGQAACFSNWRFVS